MNETRIRSLERTVRECDGACNDGDYICLCRPMDVQEALTAIKRLQAEVERLRELRDGDQEEIERLMREIRMTEDTKTTNQ